MKVFLGSPFKGLEDVRDILHGALSADHEVFWMEDFGSQEVDALTACLRLIDDSDVYVLLFGSHYGTPLKNSDYSFTHLEYEHAERTGTPVLAYIQKRPAGITRDAHTTDFLAQVKSSHLVEHKEFDSSDSLIAMVTRDLKRLERRLRRPKFPKAAAPISDETAYVLGAIRTSVLTGAPYPVTLVDAGAVADPKYRPEKRGRIGDKVESIKRVAQARGALTQVFNEFPVKQRGNVVQLKAARINQNSKLIVILVPKKTTEDVIDLFASATGERVVVHGDWFEVADRGFYAEAYSDDDLSTCELRRSVVELIEARLATHVVAQIT